MDRKEKKDTSKKRITRRPTRMEPNEDTNEARVIRRQTRMEPNEDTNRGRVTRSLAKMDDLDLSLKRKRELLSKTTTNYPGKQRKLQSGIPRWSERVEEAFENLPRTDSKGETEGSTDAEGDTNDCDTKDSADFDDTEDDLDLLGASTSKKRKRKMSIKKTKSHLQILRSILSGVRTWKEIVDEENETIPEVGKKKDKKKKKMPQIKPTNQPGDDFSWDQLDVSRLFGRTPSTVSVDNQNLLKASTSKEIEKEMPTVEPIDQPEKERDLSNGSMSESNENYGEVENQLRAEGLLSEGGDDLDLSNDSMCPLIDYTFKLVKKLKRNRILRSKLQREVLRKKDSTDSDDTEESLPSDFSDLSSQKSYPSKSSFEYHENEERFSDMSNSSIEEDQPMIKPFPNSCYLYDIESVVSEDSVDLNLGWINRGQENFPFLSFEYTYKLDNNRSVRFKKTKDFALIEEKDRIAGAALFDLLLNVDLSDVDLSGVEKSNSMNITLNNAPKMSRFEIPCAEEYASWNSQKQENVEKQVSECNARIALLELFNDIFIEMKSTKSNSNNELNSENQKRKSLSQPEIAEKFSQSKNSDESKLSESNNGLNLENQNRKTFCKPEVFNLSQSQNSDEAVAGSSCAVEEQNLSKCEMGCNVWSDINSEFWKDFDSEFWSGIHSEMNSEIQNRKTSSKQEIGEAFSQPKFFNESELFGSNNGLNSANQNRKTLSKPESAEKFSEPKTSDGDVAGSSSVVKEKYSNQCKWGCTVLKEVPCFHEKCIKYLTTSKQETAKSISQANISNESESFESNNRLNSVNQNRETLPKPQINEAFLQPNNSDEGVAGSSNVMSICKFGCTVLNEEPCLHEQWIKYVKENETKLKKEVEEKINKLKIKSRKNYEKEVIDRFIKSIANVKFTKK